MNTRTTQNTGAIRINKLLLEVRWLTLLILSIYLVLILGSYSPSDDSFLMNTGSHNIQNFGGRLGAFVSDLLYFLSGYSAYVLVFLLLWLLWQAKQQAIQIDLPQASDVEPLPKWVPFVRPIAFCALWLGLMGLESLSIVSGQNLPEGTGGILGQAISGFLKSLVGLPGSVMFLLLLTATGLSAFLGVSWAVMSEEIGYQLERIYFGTKYFWATRKDRQAGKKIALQRVVKVEEEREKKAEHLPFRIEPSSPKVEPSPRAIKEKQQPLFEEIETDKLPPLRLLDETPQVIETISEDTLEYTSRLIEKKLSDFGVQVQVVAAMPGPVITRFEIEPAAGVKGSQVVNLARDLARALSLHSIRVVETIYGKNLMGLELPNPRRQMVKLTEILGSDIYSKSASALTMALGKDISGKAVVADLAKMPHLLVAGTTGSGKSVGINAMILSLLYGSTAQEVRLMLIDPKMLEMSVYEGISHLLCPVVTDMRHAANGLNWAVNEMEKRYRLMSHLGVRNIASYNNKIREAKKKEESIPNPFSLTPDAPEPLDILPLIVIVIDELADLMMVVGKKIEELIARLAQKARAAGIHLILATQRPSVDVITGLIKANIPTRIAFQVSSKIDSRTILDQMGAEALLGQGDMLYLPPGSGNPQRIHGAFVSDDEVHRVVEYLKEKHGEPNYIEGILEGGTANDEATGVFDGGNVDGEKDALYDQAVSIVLKNKRASISYVQRNLRIGYNRAARLLESMEQAGIVSAMQSNGNREILVKQELVQD